jgi:hypothetical protein
MNMGNMNTNNTNNTNANSAGAGGFNVNTNGKPASFRSGGALLRAYADYAAACGEGKRFPNFAGFAAYRGMGRAELAALRLCYQREYDVICAALIDEALNSKIVNSGAVMEYIEGLSGELSEAHIAPGADTPLRVVCAQSLREDGA